MTGLFNNLNKPLSQRRLFQTYLCSLRFVRTLIDNALLAFYLLFPPPSLFPSSHCSSCSFFPSSCFLFFFSCSSSSLPPLLLAPFTLSSCSYFSNPPPCTSRTVNPVLELVYLTLFSCTSLLSFFALLYIVSLCTSQPFHILCLSLSHLFIQPSPFPHIFYIFYLVRLKPPFMQPV